MNQERPAAFNVIYGPLCDFVEKNQSHKIMDFIFIVCFQNLYLLQYHISNPLKIYKLTGNIFLYWPNVYTQNK